MATAIVTAGAGARGAYEAGVLSVALPRLLAEGERDVVLVGTSAGALNTAIVAGAAVAGDAAAKLERAWTTLDVDRVFTLSVRAMLASTVDFLFKASLPNYALFDTHPLERTVVDTGAVDWAAFPSNFVPSTWLRAAGVVATQARSGASVVFVQGLTTLPKNNVTRGIEYEAATIGPSHVLASAAIPVLFPSVQVEDCGWFVDGGVRLNTPISPGIDLLSVIAPEGPNRMIIVSTDPDPEPPTATPTATSTPTFPGVPTTARPISDKRPDIVDEAATLLYTMFVDRVAEDVLSLARVNALVEASGKSKLAAPRRPGRAGPPFQTIQHCYIGPATRGTVARAARDAFARRKEKQSFFARARLDVVSRALANRGESHDEILSFILFDQSFLGRLFEMGRSDAQRALGSGIPWQPASRPA